MCKAKMTFKASAGLSKRFHTFGHTFRLDCATCTMALHNSSSIICGLLRRTRLEIKHHAQRQVFSQIHTKAAIGFMLHTSLKYLTQLRCLPFNTDTSDACCMPEHNSHNLVPPKGALGAFVNFEACSMLQAVHSVQFELLLSPE